MEIVVRHKHGRVSPELRSIAAEKVGRVSRFLRDVTRIDVEFDDERNPSVADSDLCEILVHLKGNLLKAHSAASSPEAALDLTIDKMEHQARKLHERRVSRSHPKGSRRTSAKGPLPNGRPSNGSSPDVSADSADSADEPGAAPIVQVAPEDAPIVRVTQETAKPMSPREAGLQMDLLGYDFFLFTSSEHGRAAVIYRRRDGDLGLIETG